MKGSSKYKKKYRKKRRHRHDSNEDLDTPLVGRSTVSEPGDDCEGKIASEDSSSRHGVAEVHISGTTEQVERSETLQSLDTLSAQTTLSMAALPDGDQQASTQQNTEQGQSRTEEQSDTCVSLAVTGDSGQETKL